MTQANQEDAKQLRQIIRDLWLAVHYASKKRWDEASASVGRAASSQSPELSAEEISSPIIFSRKNLMSNGKANGVPTAREIARKVLLDDHSTVEAVPIVAKEAECSESHAKFIILEVARKMKRNENLDVTSKGTGDRRNLETRERSIVVCDYLQRGLPSKQIVRKLCEQFDIKPQQAKKNVDLVLREVEERIKDDAAESYAIRRQMHLDWLYDLRAKADKLGELKLCLETEDRIARTEGFNAPKREEHAVTHDIGQSAKAAMAKQREFLGLPKGKVIDIEVPERDS